VIRTLLAGAALFSVCLIALAITGYLALRQPDFYADLQHQGDSEPDIVADMEQKVREFEEWAMRSSALDSRKRSEGIPVKTAPRNDVATSNIYCLEMTEKQLNASLSSSGSSAGSVRDPRVQILDGKLCVGAEIHVSDYRFIFSGDLKPQITSEGKLRFEIMNTHLGSLPFPLHTLLNLMSEHMNVTAPKFHLDLTGQTPVVTANISRSGPNSPTVESIHCVDGSLTIEFQARNVDHTENASGTQLSNRSTETTQR